MTSEYTIDRETLLQVPADGRGWVVLHTRPRCEKKAAAYCRRQGLLFYLPVLDRRHQYGNRKRTFQAPLFPGYLFVVAAAGEHQGLRQNAHVANLLVPADQEELAEQLRHVHAALDVGDVVEVLPYLEQGRRVRVKSGPFKGLEGLVVRMRKKTRVVLNVDMIRRSIAIEVDSAWLEPA